MWLSQALGGTSLVQIRSASIRLYRIPRTEVFFSSSSLHAFICQIYMICLHLCLIRLNLNVLHTFHLEILCSRKSMFSLQVVLEPDFEENICWKIYPKVNRVMIVLTIIVYEVINNKNYLILFIIRLHLLMNFYIMMKSLELF